MTKVLIKSRLFLTALLLSSGVVAETDPNLETVLVTGTYWPVTPEDLTSTYSVLDQEYLRNTHLRAMEQKI